MPPRPGRSGRTWRRLVEQVKARRLPCWICGYPIDYTLPWRNPMTGRADPRSASIDHIVPLSRGGHPHDLRNLAAAHLWCNCKKHNKTAPDPVPTVRASRDW